MDADRRIGRAGPARHERDARPPRQRSVGAGHEGHPALLPTHDQVDRWRVVERVEHRQEALARHGEDPLAALRHELVDEDAAAGPHAWWIAFVTR